MVKTPTTNELVPHLHRTYTPGYLILILLMDACVELTLRVHTAVPYYSEPARSRAALKTGVLSVPEYGARPGRTDV